MISLTTGLEDAEKVTVAFLVAVGAAESGRPTLMFLTKEAVRLALEGFAVGVACDGCPPLRDLLRRYADAGGRYFVCPICFDAKALDGGSLIANAELAGTVPMWSWIGDEAATTFSY
ncbi:peroxiredoxin [Geodermatophilaceae bacterium NBWT11]|nr:peroxiredoxin [Geodermatophilaceae bacterium NBWT11]